MSLIEKIKLDIRSGSISEKDFKAAVNDAWLAGLEEGGRDDPDRAFEIACAVLLNEFGIIIEN